jgi:hypothetical protein
VVRRRDQLAVSGQGQIGCDRIGRADNSVGSASEVSHHTALTDGGEVSVFLDGRTTIQNIAAKVRACRALDERNAARQVTALREEARERLGRHGNDWVCDDEIVGRLHVLESDWYPFGDIPNEQRRWFEVHCGRQDRNRGNHGDHRGRTVCHGTNFRRWGHA